MMMMMVMQTITTNITFDSPISKKYKTSRDIPCSSQIVNAYRANRVLRECGICNDFKMTSELRECRKLSIFVYPASAFRDG